MMRIAAVVLMLAGTCLAQVRTDGSLGPKQNLPGPNFAIPHTLGKQAGGNLFHSFEKFDLKQGDIATFSGPGSVKSILARVTDGKLTQINGTIRSTIAGADLYLMNPQGVLIGPGGQIDISGSYTATSADYIRLGAGGRFSAVPSASDTLSTAPPAAFGFLKSSPGGVGVGATRVAVATGKSISLISGNDIVLVDATVEAPGGKITLLAARGDGEIAPGKRLPRGRVTELGGIAVGGSIVNASGDAGGSIAVRGHSMGMLNSAMGSDTFTGDGGDVDIGLSGLLQLTGTALITANALGSGAGGAVTINAGDISIEGTGVPSAHVSTNSGSGATGGGGAVTVRSQTLKLSRGGFVGANTESDADAGDVSINTGSLTADGFGSGIFGSAVTGSSGNAARIRIRADQFTLSSAAGVAALGEGTGGGGTIRIDAGSLQILGAPHGVAFIDAFAVAGQGGSIDIAAADMRIRRGRVVANTFGAGDAGQINIRAGKLVLTRRAGIGTLSVGAATGNSGSILVEAGDLIVADNSAINASTQTSGAGGNITIRARSVELDGRGVPATTALTVGATEGASGNSGNITIHADAMVMRGAAALSAESNGPGRGGDIDLIVDRFDLIGPGSLVQTATFASQGGGRGGNLRIAAQVLNMREGASLFGGTQGDAPGGAITIRARDMLVTGGSNIFAGTTQEVGGGPGGTLTIRADTLRLENKAVIIVGTRGSGAGGLADLRVRRLVIRGAPDDQGSDSATGVVVGSLGGSGPGGLLVVRDDVVDLARSVLGAGSSLSGDAGSTVIRTKTLRLDDSAVGSEASSFDDLSTASGNGGEVSITASRFISLRNGSQILAGADLADAGNISVQSDSLYLNRSSIEADAGSRGGSIRLTVRRVLSLFQSRITANGDDALGDITIDPIITVLNASTIATTTEPGAGGNISLTTEFFLDDRDSLITAAPGAIISRNIANPDVDISGAITPINAFLADNSMTLVEDCTRRILVDQSSFRLVGRGATPAEPGGLTPAR